MCVPEKHGRRLIQWRRRRPRKVRGPEAIYQTAGQLRCSRKSADAERTDQHQAERAGPGQGNAEGVEIAATPGPAENGNATVPTVALLLAGPVGRLHCHAVDTGHLLQFVQQFPGTLVAFLRPAGQQLEDHLLETFRAPTSKNFFGRSASPVRTFLIVSIGERSANGSRKPISRA